ncbi:MAG: DUF4325 domain-containing protein [Candidatus Paceibacterota bacterium]|jgi:hypothetical protein
MEIADKIIIAKDFADNLGARYRKDGENSGQQFLEEILQAKFEKAAKGNYILFIDLDKVWGYPSSFVSGSFGKLSTTHGGADVLLKHIQFKSDENPIRLEKILNEIKNPRKV